MCLSSFYLPLCTNYHFYFKLQANFINPKLRKNTSSTPLFYPITRQISNNPFPDIQRYQAQHSAAFHFPHRRASLTSFSAKPIQRNSLKPNFHLLRGVSLVTSYLPQKSPRADVARATGPRGGVVTDKQSENTRCTGWMSRKVEFFALTC